MPVFGVDVSVVIAAVVCLQAGPLTAWRTRNKDVITHRVVSDQEHPLGAAIWELVIQPVKLGHVQLLFNPHPHILLQVFPASLCTT